jgi:hypothetical protein
MEAVKVTDFFIVSATESWPRKQDNPTLGKICKAYEVRLVFSNGDSVLDRMHYLTSGASRNCFLFDSLRMVRKCYEAAGRYTTHEDEARGAPAWRAVLPNHVPEIFLWKQVPTVTNSGRNVVLDCLLTEKIGPSLQASLRELSSLSQELPVMRAKVQAFFLGIVSMTENAHRAGLRWDVDFNCGNVCWNPDSQSWYLVDLEDFSPMPTTRTLRTAWLKAAKTNLKICGNTVAEQYWADLLRTHIQSDHWSPVSAEAFRVMFQAEEAGYFDSGKSRYRKNIKHGLKQSISIN